MEGSTDLVHDLIQFGIVLAPLVLVAGLWVYLHRVYGKGKWGRLVNHSVDLQKEQIELLRETNSLLKKLVEKL